MLAWKHVGMDVVPLWSTMNISDKETWPGSHNPGVCNLWGSCLAHSPAWQLLTAELLVSAGDQVWVKKERKRKTAVQYLFWEQNKHTSIDFPKQYKTKRSYFQSSERWCLAKVLWSYFTQGICVLLAECHCLISQRGHAANGIWKLIAEFLLGSQGSACSAVLSCRLHGDGYPEGSVKMVSHCTGHTGLLQHKLELQMWQKGSSPFPPC